MLKIAPCNKSLVTIVLPSKAWKTGWVLGGSHFFFVKFHTTLRPSELHHASSESDIRHVAPPWEDHWEDQPATEFTLGSWSWSSSQNILKHEKLYRSRIQGKKEMLVSNLIFFLEGMESWRFTAQFQQLIGTFKIQCFWSWAMELPNVIALRSALKTSAWRFQKKVFVYKEDYYQAAPFTKVWINRICWVLTTFPEAGKPPGKLLTGACMEIPEILDSLIHLFPPPENQRIRHLKFGTTLKGNESSSNHPFSEDIRSFSGRTLSFAFVIF